MANLSNEDIVTQSGNIMWKLISIFGNIDQELAKLFADNKGQEAVIEILIAKQQGNGSIPYIRILNGLVQIPSLVSRMLDSGLAETVKIINDLYPDDVDVISMNFDTMKKISNQKLGRDFLINKGLVDSILKNINHCANLKNAKAVLSGLTVLDNLTRNDNGKEAIKKANGIDCLSNVLSKFETDDDILKMCAKIYSKIATNDDMKAQLEMLQKYYDDLKQNGSDSIKFSDLNKSLVLISNFMLVDEICKMLCEKDNLTLLENLFTEVTKISLDNKTEEFVDAYLLTNKYFMIIFYRIFAAKPEIYDKTTQIGKEKSELIKKIQSSLEKIWESIHSKVETNEAVANVFRSYWNSYNDIIYQNYISINDQNEVDKDYIKTLEYMVKNIIVNGKKYFETKHRPNFIASRVLKTASVISKDLLPDIEKCYEYLMHLFTTSEDCDTLSNVTDVLYSLLTQIPSFKSKNIEDIIVAVSQFALNKHKFRYPSLICLKIYDLYLTSDFLSVYLKTPDANNKKTHAVNYVNCICSILTDSFYVSSTVTRPLINNEKRDNAVENEISELSTVLLKRLIDSLEFKTRVKHFKEQSESFDSLKANNDAIIALENSMIGLYGLMNIDEYYSTGAEDLLAILKELIAKEVSNYEMYKRDKEKMKDVNYFDTLRCLSNRICTELSLVLKINDIAVKKEELSIVAKSYDIIFTFLNKSSDIPNIKIGLENLNSRCKFILDNEAEINLEKKEIVSEKVANTNVVLLRRLIEEEEAIREIINSHIIFCTAKSSLCNILVKGGCPRMLLQIMENTPNPKTAEIALELLKIIAFSNPENLTMVANQNVLLKFYELRAKYAGNDTITSNCDLISNEIMKLPGQEKYAEDVINEAINEFNENAKLDYTSPETKSKLLANIEVINAFTTNKKIIELLLKGEFLNNLNNVFDKTVNDKEVSQVNEKLLTNELSLFSKIKTNCEYNNEIIVDKLLDIIRNKSNYNEILLFATRIFGTYLKDENQYNNLIAKKIDTSFIDLLFEISDNYLDDAKVSKELNNILCLLCLRNEKFAAYIKQRGGLANVLEDLKANVFINDPQTQQVKLNSLKMLNSLISDDTGLDMFIKANGVELINNLIKNETNLLGSKYDEIDRDDLYTTNETLQFPKECEKSAESYFLHVLRIIKSGVQRGKKSFLDNKALHALIYIAIAKYPDINLVKELCEIVNEESVALPETEVDRFAFLKCVYSIKAKFDFCDKCAQAIETVNKAVSKMSTEVAKSDKYITDMQEVLKDANVSESNINIRNLLLTYLSIAVSDQERHAFIAKAIKEIAGFYGEVCEVYLDRSKPLNENLKEGVVISLMRIAAFLLKQDKKSISTADLVEDLIFLGCHFYDPQNADYDVEFMRIFDLVNEALGKYKNDDKKEFSKNYVDYLQNMHGKSFEFFDDFTANLKESKDYSLVSKNKKNAIQYILNDTKIYYSSNDDLDIKSGYAKQLVDGLSELSASLLETKDIPPEEQVSLLQSIWSIIRNALTNPELTDFVFDEKTVTSLFTSMRGTVNVPGYKDTQNNFPAIINAICSKTENSNEIFEKIIEYITRELSSLTPAENESIDTNISSLANLSKYSIAMKLMLNKVLLMQKLREFYDDDKINMERRRNLAVIYSNAVKNSYNIDTLVVNDPQAFKVLAKRIASPESVIKEKENFDIAANEIETVNTIMKDRNNYKTMGEKELIQEGDMQNAITNYEKCEDESIKSKIAETKSIIESHRSLKREQTNLQMDENILQNLKGRIESAFDAHINEVDKATPATNTPDEKEKQEKSSKDLGFVRQMSLMVTTGSVVQKASNVKKGRLSIISRHLFYNEHNGKIISPISTKSHEDIASALDSLLALIRSIYNSIKNTTDIDFKKKREALLLEALRLLKMLSICPDNHQPILVLGLLGFMERLVEDHSENLLIYIACLDILKNCTWSESAVLALIESPLLDKLIDEVIAFYAKPEELMKNDELKSCFLYNNINFSNMCKYPKGFEIIFKKIGIEKLRELGLKTGNVDFLAAIIEMFINYINNNPKEELKDDLIDDILKICEKGLSLPEKTESVFSKALKLLGMIYKTKLLEKVQKIEIEPKVNECFDSYKTEPDFLMNCIHTLAVIAVDDNKVSTAIVESKLLDKIINEVMNSDLNNDLIENLSLLYKNLLLNNADNQIKMCKEEVINNIIFFIQRYQKKCKPTLRSCATMNPALLNEKIQAATEGTPVTFDTFSIENRILINLITALDLITKQERSTELISKSKFLSTLLETIEKPNTDIEIIKVSLHCMGNYFIRNTSDYWKHYEIELLYNILKALLKQYYANSELLIYICQIAGYILKGFDSKLYTEKFYLLVIDCLNCQDWNLPLVIIALKIIKDSLTRHENLRADVFEQTKQTLLNLLRLYYNNVEIQVLCFDIFSLFNSSSIHMYFITHEVTPLFLECLQGTELNAEESGKVAIRKSMLNLISVLATEEGNAEAIACEIMKPLLLEIDNEYSESLVISAKIIATLLNKSSTLPPFSDNAGLETMMNTLNKNQDHPDALLVAFRILASYINGSEQNKTRAKSMRFEEIINVLIGKNEKSRKVAFEGKNLIYLLNYVKGQKSGKEYMHIDFSEIRAEKSIKTEIKAFLTRGKTVKIVNPKGKVKEMQLMFSQDLLKVYCKKLKANLPPKAKYLIETPHIVKITKGHGTEIFKKTKGIFKSAPKPELCFSILGTPDGSKSINVECESEAEVAKWVSYIDKVTNYIKSKLV